ncbi:MAG: hypothetical protein WBB86_03610, partial [Candidatus Omnitrophota bacterium]
MQDRSDRSRYLGTEENPYVKALVRFLRDDPGMIDPFLEKMGEEEEKDHVRRYLALAMKKELKLAYTKIKITPERFYKLISAGSEMQGGKRSRDAQKAFEEIKSIAIQEIKRNPALAEKVIEKIKETEDA